MDMSRCWPRWKPMPGTGPAGDSRARRRLGPPVWDRPSATGSSGTRGAGGCSSPPIWRMCPVATDRRLGVIGVDLNADHLAVAETDTSGNYLNAWRASLVTYGRNTHQAEALIGDAVAGVVSYAKEAGKPIVIEKLDFRQKKGCAGGRVPQVQPDALVLRLRQGQGLLPVPGLPPWGGSMPGQPGLQFRHWPGQIHGTIRAQRPSGSSLGTGPAFTRMLGTHPPPVGLSRRQWRSCRLHRTCKEAGEARVDVLGCDLRSAETGACSAAPAGEAETQTQSGSGCWAGGKPAGWPERGPVRSSRVRVPGGAVLHCWGGGAAQTASLEKADSRFVTKVNLFCNGQPGCGPWRKLGPFGDHAVPSLPVDM